MLKLARIAEMSSKQPDIVFTSIAHLINEDLLKKYAEALGISYRNRTNDEIDKTLGDEVMRNAKSESADAVESYTETYWIIALALIGLILWDFYVVFNKVLLERKAK